MHCHKENAISKESEGKGVTSTSLALLKSETSMAYAKHKKEHGTQRTIDTQGMPVTMCLCVYVWKGVCCPRAGCMLTCNVGKNILY